MEYIDCYGCPWIEPDQERIDKLIKLQRWFDRFLRRKSIEKIIPKVSEYWFSPDGPGCRAAIKRLNKRKLEINLNESCKKQK